MSRTAFVVPSKDSIVIKPDTMKALSASGESVELNSYWLRRLSDGDVSEGTPPAKSKTPAKAQE